MSLSRILIPHPNPKGSKDRDYSVVGVRYHSEDDFVVFSAAGDSAELMEEMGDAGV
jgi:hypothetical protein